MTIILHQSPVVSHNCIFRKSTPFSIHPVYIGASLHPRTPAEMCARADAQDHFSRIRSTRPWMSAHHPSNVSLKTHRRQYKLCGPHVASCVAASGAFPGFSWIDDFTNYTDDNPRRIFPLFRSHVTRERSANWDTARHRRTDRTIDLCVTKDAKVVSSSCQNQRALIKNFRNSFEYNISSRLPKRCTLKTTEWTETNLIMLIFNYAQKMNIL